MMMDWREQYEKAIAERNRLIQQLAEKTDAIACAEAEAAECRAERARYGDMMTERLCSAETEVARLNRQLVSVLEVAIARGEKLGYSDDDYRALWRDLTGADWQSEIGD